MGNLLRVLLATLAAASALAASPPWPIVGSSSVRTATTAEAGSGVVSWQARLSASADTVPDGATLDRRHDAVVFTRAQVRLTIVAADPVGRPGWYEVAGMPNPKIVVPLGAAVRVRLVNLDPSAPHDWRLAEGRQALGFFPARVGVALAAASARLPPAQAARVASTRFSFVARLPGTFTYFSSVPGQAMYGMHGTLVVSGTLLQTAFTRAGTVAG